MQVYFGWMGRLDIFYGWLGLDAGRWGYILGWCWWVDNFYEWVGVFFEWIGVGGHFLWAEPYFGRLEVGGHIYEYVGVAILI